MKQAQQCYLFVSTSLDTQDEILEEIMGAKDCLNDYKELKSLKKLDAFVSEIMRLYQLVLEHNRKITADEGLVLPLNPPIKLKKHSVIGMDGYSLHRDPEYWPNPDKFDMTRFYPENRHKMKPCTYIPFGLGPRNCVGMPLGLLEIKLCLAKILPKYLDYPPKYAESTFMLQLKDSRFELVLRSE